MRLLKKIQTKALVLCMIFLAVVFALAGVGLSRSSVNAAADESKITYIDTEVEGIAFTQHPTCVFFGFKLTESDYDDFNNWEGDFAGTSAFAAYEQYITSKLTYWKDFSQMNSEGVSFVQLYAYWSAGLDPTTHSYPLPPTQFTNSVAHRSSLDRLNFGFTIYIPAGTTFPSAAYVKNGCEGEPVMYRTTENRGFYYDGSTFQPLSYTIAQDRQAAMEEVKSIDYNAYREAERTEVRALVEKASATLNMSFTSVALEDALLAFYAELDEIMTIADYEALDKKKAAAKTELSAFFSGLDQEAYEEADWDKILSMQGEYSALIDGLENDEEVAAAVVSVKFTVGNVLTKEERTAFAAYQEAAIQRVEDAFVEALYREQERVQGAAWVQEAKMLIEQAATQVEVDGIEVTYSSRIQGLKTQAQWENEEQNNKPIDSTEKEESSVDETPKEEKSGCGSSLNQVGTMFCAVITALMVINKRRMGKEDEK